ncbi:N-acetylmuramidase family protein [Xenorhabdus szentirmaii]|uniref:N-acetylmuramidase family protein n=1 Tax=Xenorhabdus szentirmaii TaxID=290112 RepID=UPI002B4012B1|nr:N-acetylmuramidase family protein [Xenorhabdus sp. CUL]
MWNKDIAINTLNKRAKPKSQSDCAKFTRIAIESGGVKIEIPPPRPGNGAASAKDYGPSLEDVGFVAVYRYSGNPAELADVFSIPGQQAGDVVVIQSKEGSPHGHMAMFNGTHWVSDFKQSNGPYPGPGYRKLKPSFVMYRYDAEKTEEKPKEEPVKQNKKIKISWPISKNNRGAEFSNQDEILAHLEGEPSGYYLLGRNGMWHGGIHITSVTTPWCALSGNDPAELKDLPKEEDRYKGEQALRCVADGEVVAFRVCKNYLEAPWIAGNLKYSGSFLLVRHRIQPGKTDKSALTFYSLYMQMAPWLVYEYQHSQQANDYVIQGNLAAYEDKELSQKTKKVLPKQTRVTWDEKNTELVTENKAGRKFGCVTLEQDVKFKQFTFTKGEKVWVLVDRDNIKKGGKSLEQIAPGWLKPYLPGGKEPLEFDKVVSVKKPYSISAGDAVGHLGYVQLPIREGHKARYRAHIETLTIDDNLATFLTNPDAVKEGTEYLKYKPGLTRYSFDVRTKEFVKQEVKTRSNGIITLSKAKKEIVKNEKDKTQKEYYQIHKEACWLEKADVEILSQYDLGKLGFTMLTESPVESFDHLDGKNAPTVLVRNLLELLKKAAEQDLRLTHALAPRNYQRLLDKIDSLKASDKPARYSEAEFLQAIHNPHVRDELYRTIVKHPSEWYYRSTDSFWETLLTIWKKSSSEIARYNIETIDKLVWMPDVKEFKSKPEVWHMHPLVLLDSIKIDEYPKTIINGKLEPIEFLAKYDNEKIDESDYISAAKQLNCEVAAIKAVAQTETGSAGSYFKFDNDDDYVLSILFERHHFSRYTNGIYDSEYSEISNKKAGGYGRHSEQYRKIALAYSLNKVAALKSASWGKFQILGSNHITSGYSSVEEFVLDLSRSEKNHLKAFVNFIQSNKKLHNAIVNKDWLSFALIYNGPSQKGYDAKMKANYDKITSGN